MSCKNVSRHLEKGSFDGFYDHSYCHYHHHHQLMFVQTIWCMSGYMYQDGIVLNSPDPWSPFPFCAVMILNFFIYKETCHRSIYIYIYAQISPPVSSISLSTKPLARTWSELILTQGYYCPSLSFLLTWSLAITEWMQMTS